MKKIISIMIMFMIIGSLKATAGLDLILSHEPFGGGIWSMNPDGTNLTELSDFGWFAQYSSGCNKIAFGDYYYNGIWTMDPVGSNKVQITTEGNNPSWSPDGSKIVFVSGGTQPTHAASRRLWIVNADGTGLHQLTFTPSDQPDWQNFGDKIVYTRSTPNPGIYTINSDGSGETLISTIGSGPSWTPDDNQIVYTSGQIHTMNPDGTNKIAVSTTIGNNPSMGENGSIAFEISGDQIMVVDEFGVETSIASNRLAPDWGKGDANPPYPLAYIFSGVGLIPATEIVDGYATTMPGYFIFVENAPFGSKINVFGNYGFLHANSIARYKITMAKWPDASTPPSPGDYTDIVQSWGNYIWDSVEGKFIYRVVSPDPYNTYRVNPPSEDWYLDDLLVQWNTRTVANGKYTLKMRVYDATWTEYAIVSDANELTLVIDNTAPTVEIHNVNHNGSPIGHCAIVNMSDPTDTLEFVVSVNDADGNLRRWALKAHYGDNQSFPIAGETYDPLVHGSSWSGITTHSIIHDSWPETCAYQFRLSGWGRATNGYSRIHYNEYNKHSTLILPGSGLCGD